MYYQTLKYSRNYDDFLKLQAAISEVSNLIVARKDEYHSHLARKLINPKTSAKAYWSILKTFYNGRKFL